MKTTRNLNSKYVTRDDNTIPLPDGHQVCNDYSNIVNSITKDPNSDSYSCKGCPPLAKSQEWTQSPCTRLPNLKNASTNGDVTNGVITCNFDNGTVITIDSRDNDGTEQGAFHPCAGTTLGLPVPQGSSLPENDGACYDALKNAGCITSSSEPAPTPKPTPKPTPGPSPSPTPAPESRGLSTPAIIGISVGGVVLVIGIGLVIMNLIKKKRKGRKK